MQKRKIIENDDEFKWTTKRFATQKRSETENGRDGWDFITRNRRSNFPAALSAKSLTFSPSQNFLFLMLFGVTDPPNDPTNERLSYQREDKYLFLFVCTLVVEHHNRPFNKCIKFNSGSQTVCLPIYLSTFDLWKKLFDFNMMDEPCCWAKVGNLYSGFICLPVWSILYRLCHWVLIFLFLTQTIRFSSLGHNQPPFEQLNCSKVNVWKLSHLLMCDYEALPFQKTFLAVYKRLWMSVHWMAFSYNRNLCKKCKTVCGSDFAGLPDWKNILVKEGTIIAVNVMFSQINFDLFQSKKANVERERER